jgi:hypothetical protein
VEEPGDAKLLDLGVIQAECPGDGLHEKSDRLGMLPHVSLAGVDHGHELLDDVETGIG